MFNKENHSLLLKAKASSNTVADDQSKAAEHITGLWLQSLSCRMQSVFLHLWSGFNMKTVTLNTFLKAQTSLYDSYHEPRRSVKASSRSCFLAPVVGIPNCLQASFNTGTVSFPRVPFCRWALSSSSGTSTLGFFSAPPPASAVIETVKVKVHS